MNKTISCNHDFGEMSCDRYCRDCGQDKYGDES